MQNQVIYSTKIIESPGNFWIRDVIDVFLLMLW